MACAGVARRSTLMPRQRVSAVELQSCRRRAKTSSAADDSVGPSPADSRRGLYTLLPALVEESGKSAWYIEEQHKLVLSTTLDNERIVN